jgi:ADP-heptose:LPS heptosyltransferase
LRVPDAARISIRSLLDARGIALDRPWIVVHPGASAPSRRYPAAGFAAVARRLVAEAGWQIVFTGLPDEHDLIAAIQENLNAPSHAFVGGLNLGELAALIEAAPLLLTNNTGPAHIAAAVGTPVVDLYALTNPQHTPWAVPNRVLSHDVPCKNCFKSICPMGHHDCLRQVAPDAVVAAIFDLFDEAGATRFGAAARPVAEISAMREWGRQAWKNPA